LMLLKTPQDFFILWLFAAIALSYLSQANVMGAVEALWEAMIFLVLFLEHG